MDPAREKTQGTVGGSAVAPGMKSFYEKRGLAHIDRKCTGSIVCHQTVADYAKGPSPRRIRPRWCEGPAETEGGSATAGLRLMILSPHPLSVVNCR
jgi:hypothetical protein